MTEPNYDDSEGRGMVATVAIKLPPFWPADPLLLFGQAESQFTTRGITREVTKFHHVVASLPPEIAAEVRDVILSSQPSYGVLRKAVIDRTSDSECRWIHRLLAVEELGDHKPSHLLRHLQTLLCDMLSSFDPKLLRELFLQRLPTNVQMILAQAADLTLEKLANMADQDHGSGIAINFSCYFSRTTPQGEQTMQSNSGLVT